MLRARVRRGLRWGALSIATIVAASALAGSAAEARNRYRPAATSYQPSYASIVVDANSGAVLQSTSADSQRHPASLTKIMTLYLLFERLEAGKLKLNSELKVSAHAAAMAPSKLALKPGETIGVDTAIKAIVTKSANDVAVVIAEAIAGDEDDFAKLMTRKARALGMKHTVYRNASGLPDDDQVTTARDQVLLGRAIQDRFPRYYRYFSTQAFSFRGKSLRNHNMLLGAIEGVDGIKTGYTRSSGFNLVSSVRRGKRHIVAAVFGGKTARARDVRMVGLIEEYLARAAVKRTAPAIVETAEAVPVAAPQRPASEPRITSQAAESQANQAAEPRLNQLAEPRTTQSVLPIRVDPVKPAVSAAAPNAQMPKVGSTDPIKPNLVKTVAVKSASMKTTAMLPSPNESGAVAKVTLPSPKHDTKVETRIAAKAEAKSDSLPPPPPGAKPGVLGVMPVQVASAYTDTVPAPAATARPRGGWLIQVGALDNENEAKQRLDQARNSAKALLGDAEPFTETVAKGEKTLYRARFGGLTETQAEAACKQLKRSNIVCMSLKN
jgi:D-alanyl-D-alanine carboxypeptidase